MWNNLLKNRSCTILISSGDQLFRRRFTLRTFRLYQTYATCILAVFALITIGLSYMTGYNHYLQSKIKQYEDHISMQETAIDILNNENHRIQSDLWETARALDVSVSEQHNDGSHSNKVDLLNTDLSVLGSKLNTVSNHLLSDGSHLSHLAVQTEMSLMERDITFIESRIQRLSMVTENSSHRMLEEMQESTDHLTGLKEVFRNVKSSMKQYSLESRKYLKGHQFGVPCSIDMQHKIMDSTHQLAGELNRMSTIVSLISKLSSDHLKTLSINEDDIVENVRDYKAAAKKLEESLLSYYRLPLGHPLPYDISSSFGMRRDPFTNETRRHNGVDFAAPGGTEIHVPADGTVTHAERRGAFGLFVQVDHENGYVSRYAHLSSKAVTKGDSLIKGDLVGQVGTTGRSTGNHLHYEILFGNDHLNPKPFVESMVRTIDCNRFENALSKYMKGNVIVSQKS